MSDPMIDALREAAEDLTEQFEAAVDGAIKNQDLEYAVDLIVAADELKKAVGGASTSAKTKLAHELKDRHTEIGAHDVEKVWGLERKNWQHDELSRNVSANVIEGLAGARVIDKNGEAIELDEVAEMLRKGIIEAAGISYWRVTPLKSRFGKTFDVDKYCDKTLKDPSVIIRGSRA